MKNKNSLILNIGKLWNSAEGTTEKLKLDVPVSFYDKEIQPVSNFSCDVMLIKLKKEISVVITNGKISVNSICEKCLSPFLNVVKIPEAEREFVAYKKHDLLEHSESFPINIEDMTIDLNDMVRQEIFLHFPLILVCLKSCKGICSFCGENLNLKKCNCSIEKEYKNQPFKDLKKIMKQ